MEKLTLEQLRAVLEARKLRQTVQTRALSRVERQSLQQLSKIIANVADTEGSDVVSLPDLDAAASEEPLPDIPSEEILQEMRRRQKVLYGEDDRVEVISSKDMDRRHKARSVAAIVERRDLVALEDGQVSIGGTTLGDRYAALGKPLCTREAFRGQPCVAIGTAFLVAPTIVATAHHCLNEATVDHRCLVFDFETDAAGAVLTTFRNDQIYGIRRFLAGAFTVDAEDWALVELDRAVTDREPLALRSTGTASDNLPLYVIGHPAGLPKKIAGNAEIRVNTPASHFVANLDTYGGNSGSPVFNALSHEVEAILVRGESDFVPLGNCYASLVCPITGCRGEDCSRIEPIARFLDMQG